MERKIKKVKINKDELQAQGFNLFFFFWGGGRIKRNEAVTERRENIQDDKKRDGKRERIYICIYIEGERERES